MRLCYSLAIAAIALGSCASEAPAPDKAPLPRAVTARQLSDGGDRCMRISGWPDRISPGGDRLALTDSGGDGTVLLVEGRATADLLAQRAFVGWSEDATLWTVTPTGVIESWDGERLNPQTELNALVANEAPSKVLGVLPGWNRVGGGDGLALYARPSRSQFKIIDLQARTAAKITVGDAWGQKRPAVAFRTGRDANGEKHVFISHEVLDARSPLNPATRVEVFSAKGDRVFAGETKATEVSLTGRMVSAGPLVLARQGEYRCVFAMTPTGAMVPQGACDRDRQSVVLDGDLKETAFVPFNAYETVRSDGARQRGRLQLVEDGRGRAIYETVTADGRIAIETETPTGFAPVFSEFSPDFCSPKAVARGEPLQARLSDGEVAEGVLFTPGTTPTGIVVYYHGGPYQTSTDLEGGVVAALVEQGFAVIAVNYRGTPGYGTRFIERAYETGPEGMLDDGRALTREAQSRLGAQDRPVYVYGVSWGGYLALRELTDPASTVQGGLLQSAVCRIDLSVDDVTFADGSVPLSRVIDPSSVVHQIRLLGPQGADDRLNVCNAPLPAGRRVVVVHSQRDPRAPLAPIQAWSSAQGDAQVSMTAAPGSAHPYPGRDESAPLVATAIEFWTPSLQRVAH